MARASEELRKLREEELPRLREDMARLECYLRALYRMWAWTFPNHAKSAGVLPGDHPDAQ